VTTPVSVLSGGALPLAALELGLRLQMTAPAMSSNASAPRTIEMTAEWRANIATTIRTTGVMIRKARDVLLEETSRY
jgi:hypothetical protein